MWKPASQRRDGWAWSRLLSLGERTVSSSPVQYAACLKPWLEKDQGHIWIYRPSFHVQIPIIKIRWSWDCQIFIMKISILLAHWCQVTHICGSKIIIIGSDNGLSPGRRLAIIWTNAGILLTGPSGTNFSDNLSKIHTFSFKIDTFENVVQSDLWISYCIWSSQLTCIFFAPFHFFC